MGLPNPTVLISGVVLQEAKASSEIGNIVTTNDDLYRATGSDDPKASPEAKEVHRYREALWDGYTQLRNRPLSTNLFVDICRTIRQVEVDVRTGTGTRIARGDGEVIYTPPEGEPLLRAKLANLEQFIHADARLEPLVRLAVMHNQFEAIHPFTDGNGRTGRVANVLFLLEQGLLDLPVLYLSGYILAHRAAYYLGFRGVTERHEWEAWVLYILRAVASTAEVTRERIAPIRTQMERVRMTLQREEPAIYSKDLVELVFQKPYCRIVDAQRQLDVSRPTAAKYLRTLANLGVLRKRRRVGRSCLSMRDCSSCCKSRRPSATDRQKDR